MLVRTILALSVLCSVLQAFAQPCAWETSPVLLERDAQIAAYLVTAHGSLLDEKAPVPFSEQRQIATWLNRKLPQLNPWDQIGLLRRQREIFVDHFGERYAHNFNVILDGWAGEIKPVGCIEALLLKLYATRVGENAKVTEFAAYILQRDDKAKIYAVSSMSSFVPAVPSVVNRVRSDISNGWKLQIHLHNHPFFPDNSTGDIAGTIVPSGFLSESSTGGDLNTFVRLFAEYSLQEFWITNAFHTLHVPIEHLEKFD